MADEIRTQATEGQKKDLADTIAKALWDSQQDQRGSFYLQVGECETELQFPDEPSTEGLRSHEFRVSCEGSNEYTRESDPNGASYEEWEDVLVVSVRYERRRPVR